MRNDDEWVIFKYISVTLFYTEGRMRERKVKLKKKQEAKKRAEEERLMREKEEEVLS